MYASNKDSGESAPEPGLLANGILISTKLQCARLNIPKVTYACIYTCKTNTAEQSYIEDLT